MSNLGDEQLPIEKKKTSSQTRSQVRSKCEAGVGDFSVWIATSTNVTFAKNRVQLISGYIRAQVAHGPGPPEL